jgi:hypothetical protein
MTQKGRLRRLEKRAGLRSCPILVLFQDQDDRDLYECKSLGRSFRASELKGLREEYILLIVKYESEKDGKSRLKRGSGNGEGTSIKEAGRS